MKVGVLGSGIVGETARFGDIVVLAVKGAAAESALEHCQAELDGKVVIDTTNPIAAEPPEDGVLRFFTGPNESTGRIRRSQRGNRRAEPFTVPEQTSGVGPQPQGSAGPHVPSTQVVAGGIAQSSMGQGRPAPSTRGSQYRWYCSRRRSMVSWRSGR